MKRRALAIGLAAAAVLGTVTGLFQPRRRPRRAPRMDVRTPEGGHEAAIAAGVRAAEPGASDALVAAVLAWADSESGVGRAMVGDPRWATLRPEAYRRYVLEEPAYASNPWRDEPAAWKSYGYFHQLAAHWLRQAIELGIAAVDAHPQILADPAVSIALGVPMVLGYLQGEAEHGWPEAWIRARLKAKGCGADGSGCPAAEVAAVRARARSRLDQWGLLVNGPDLQELSA